VRKVEGTKTGGQDRPAKDCVIADSRHEAVDAPFAVAKEPVKG